MEQDVIRQKAGVVRREAIASLAQSLDCPEDRDLM